jgi:hypothetical protein
MKSLAVPLFRLEIGVRWGARLLTALLLGIVLAIFIGEGGFNPLKLKGVEPIQMFLFWTSCIGMVVAWRWQLVGGALSLGGMMLFFAVEVAVTGGLPRLPFLYLMLLPGMLFLVDAYLRRRLSVG